jgi:hypothetical protein
MLFSILNPINNSFGNVDFFLPGSLFHTADQGDHFGRISSDYWAIGLF